MTARAWDDSLLERYGTVDDLIEEAYGIAEDPSWDDATELLWDEHLARQEGRAEDREGVTL